MAGNEDPGGHADASKAPVERAVELVVYAPLGLALFARELLPPLVEQAVSRGRTKFEELRLIGQFAVTTGTRQLRHEVEERFRRPAAPAPATPPSRVEAAVNPGIVRSPNGDAASRARAAALPIPDYDELSASQVVARLAGLTGDELAAVREYEESQRQRKTILTRIEQLTA